MSTNQDIPTAKAVPYEAGSTEAPPTVVYATSTSAPPQQLYVPEGTAPSTENERYGVCRKCRRVFERPPGIILLAIWLIILILFPSQRSERRTSPVLSLSRVLQRKMAGYDCRLMHSLLVGKLGLFFMSFFSKNNLSLRFH
jgi:hypothetical protein